MNSEVYTIGHSTHSIEEFISLLSRYNIDCVVGVRSVPFSRYAPQFNEDQLKAALGNAGIRYIQMGKEFGARRENRELYREDGKLDFEKTADDSVFRQGVERIRTGISKGFRIALMCTEKHPIDCHRAIMVGRGFELDGVNVKHILADGTLLAQEELNGELVKSAHDNGIKVMPWTVNDINLINKYALWGVDGIITDYPDIMRNKLNSL